MRQVCLRAFGYDKQKPILKNLAFMSSLASSSSLEVSSYLPSLLDQARAAGAEACDASLALGQGASVSVRQGRVEEAVASEKQRLSLRVMCGKQAAVATTDRPFDAMHIEKLIADALARAGAVPPDPHFVMADEDQLARRVDTLPVDTTKPTLEQLKTMALQTEDTARAVQGISDSEGAEAGFSHTTTHVITSGGFYGYEKGAGYSLGASVLAGTGDDRQRDGYGASAARFTDLEAADVVGRTAGQRTVRCLSARPLPQSGHFPVFFEDLLAPSLVGHFLAAINGASVAKGTTFLRDALETQVFAPSVTIEENPHVPHTFGAALFDGEGLPTVRRNLVEAGVLTTWLLNLRAAKLLGKTPTGHASLMMGGAPGVASHHVCVRPGKETPEALMREAGTGFLATELLGSGVNGLTGDYSLGARGFWVENGQVAFPVQRVTLAGRLQDMFAGLTPANDLKVRSAVNAPTLRIDKMAVTT